MYGLLFCPQAFLKLVDDKGTFTIPRVQSTQANAQTLPLCCCEGEGTCKWCKIEGPSGYAIAGEPKIALDYNGERDMIKRKPIEHSIVAYYGKMKKRKLGLQF